MRTEEYYIGEIKVTKIINDEEDLSTEEDRNYWLSICESCVKYNEGKCGECGCIVLSMMSLKESKCPINKW
jgi:hypothetical protein